MVKRSPWGNLGSQQGYYMYAYHSPFRKFYRFLWLLLIPVSADYAGGAAALLWSGLPVSKISWSTFIIFNIEFHHQPIYNTLLTVSWIGFCIPIVISLLVILRKS